MQGKLDANKRTAHGKSELRSMRSQGQVPGVIYGKGVQPVDIFMHSHPLMKTLHETGRVMEVTVKGGKSYLCSVESIQRDPVTLRPIHAAFHELDRNKKTVLSLPIVLENEGKCPGASDGGIVILSHQHIDVEGLPTDLPESIHVDVKKLNLHESIHVYDLTPPAKCNFLKKDWDLVIASCTTTRAEIEAAPEAEVISVEDAAAAATAAKAADSATAKTADKAAAKKGAESPQEHKKAS